MANAILAKAETSDCLIVNSDKFDAISRASPSYLHLYKYMSVAPHIGGECLQHKYEASTATSTESASPLAFGKMVTAIFLSPFLYNCEKVQMTFLRGRTLGMINLINLTWN